MYPHFAFNSQDLLNVSIGASFSSPSQNERSKWIKYRTLRFWRLIVQDLLKFGSNKENFGLGH